LKCVEYVYEWDTVPQPTGRTVGHGSICRADGTDMVKDYIRVNWGPAVSARILAYTKQSKR